MSQVPRVYFCDNCVFFINDCGLCVFFRDFHVHFQPDLFCFSVKSKFLKRFFYE